MDAYNIEEESRSRWARAKKEVERKARRREEAVLVAQLPGVPGFLYQTPTGSPGSPYHHTH